MTAYRHCLEGSIDAALRRDAEFNLELAGHRWRLAKPPPPGQGNDPTPDPPTPKNVGDDPPPRSKKSGDGVGDPRKDGSKSGSDDPDGSSDSKRPALGPVTVLPDHGERAQLSPAEAEAHLDQHLTRILREVRGYRERTEPAPRGKDW